MREIAAILTFFVASAAAVSAAPLPACNAGAVKFSPCELQFAWTAAELPAGKSPYNDEVLNVEFRAPDGTTYLMRGFTDGGQSVRVRFTPTQPGAWAYRITSVIKRFDTQEATFTVADSSKPGFVSVANVRHWWTSNKQPHLWMSVEVPWMQLDQAAFRAWVDARKQDGFTHIRGVLLTGSSTQGGAPMLDGKPNPAYFAALDDRLIYADSLGLTLDLILGDDSFRQNGLLDRWDTRTALIRYLAARYGALNVDWQGVEHFEDLRGTRALLREIAALLDRYDVYRHPKSTDARVTSSVLLSDHWENFIVEASPHAELAAVERQITAAPQIHIIQGSDADSFRHELWHATTNGEYPVMRYDASSNAANLQAMRVWFKVMSGVRHWEFEPFFDVDGARAVGLDNVEYLLYAEKPANLEISFSEKHKYNPRWINPSSGAVTELKDVSRDVYTEQTPAGGGDWILQVPRDGQKQGMLRSYKFESVEAPVQEVETNPDKLPFNLVEPKGDTLPVGPPVSYAVKLRRPTRATRSMQYLWIGEVVAGGEGPRVLAVGASGTFSIPAGLVKTQPALLNLRINAINANGKAYLATKVYQIAP